MGKSSVRKKVRDQIKRERTAEQTANAEQRWYSKNEVYTRLNARRPQSPLYMHSKARSAAWNALGDHS